MINFSDSIDTTVFMALTVSETCQRVLHRNCPCLFCGGPGTGKTSSVYYFAEKMGMNVTLLRISNETPDTLTGYDIAANVDDANTTSAKHIRPSWFQKILDDDKKGIANALILDELGCADVYTQGAALNICFERKVHEERLPASTLIISCTNYADNLSSANELLAPLLNRFLVVNIIPKQKDIKHFLCKYEGAAIGHKLNLTDELSKAIDSLKEQGIKDPSEDYIDKIGEVLEQSVRTEAEIQAKEGVLDLAVSELKNIYSGNEDNEVEGMPNFFSFRSAGYLVEACIACYLNFGKAGLLSDNFKKIIHGTVGLALSRGKDGEIKKTIVTDRYYAAIADAANDIEKMNNDKLPEYQNFFNEILDRDEKASISNADMGLVTKKIHDMLEDKDLSKLDRPVESGIVQILVHNLLNTLKNNKYDGVNYDNTADLQKDVQINPDRYINYVTTWNTAAELMGELNSLVKDQKKKYSNDTKQVMNKALKDCHEYVYNLKLIRKIITRTNKALAEMVPEIRPLN